MALIYQRPSNEWLKSSLNYRTYDFSPPGRQCEYNKQEIH